MLLFVNFQIMSSKSYRFGYLAHCVIFSSLRVKISKGGRDWAFRGAELLCGKEEGLSLKLKK